MDYLKTYELWKTNNFFSEAIHTELAELDPQKDLKEIEDRFYKDLEFGTGGLRGILAAGTNRMNEWTVAKASQGLANYVRHSFESPSIAVSYDSRIKSEEFARTAAEVFAKNGIKVYIFSELMPTPVLSFTTRNLHCSAGIMITASHNPAKYNGYKVYGADGCQITDETANAIQDEINKVEIEKIERGNFKEETENGRIEWIGTDIFDAYIEAVKEQSVPTVHNIKIIYTPLNGTGLRPVTRILREVGFEDIDVVKEQEFPDGNFPTCPYPNPEIREAMSLGLRDMQEKKGDILLATDPDADRVGIAVKDGDEYRLMTGNQVGALLVDFLVRNRKMEGNEAIVKTVVTSELGAEIGRCAGIKIFSVLTGFKFIGERIGQFEERKDQSFLFGYEESYGYLAGTHARDKDAVVASMLICEMAAYWKEKGMTLLKRMQDIYKEFGYYRDDLDSFTLEGKDGLERIGNMMNELRSGEPLFEGEVIDYCSPVSAEEGYGFLPTSNVLKYILDDGSWIAIRPSGTEPKIKVYYSIKGEDKDKAGKRLEKLRARIVERLGL